MAKFLRQLIPSTWRRALRERFAERLNRRVAYSQEGEDLVLLRMFEGQNAGVYVDVGAHHPFRFSNTCLLHIDGDGAASTLTRCLSP
jgi:hypothetical protein